MVILCSFSKQLSNFQSSSRSQMQINCVSLVCIVRSFFTFFFFFQLLLILIFSLNFWFYIWMGFCSDVRYHLYVIQIASVNDQLIEYARKRGVSFLSCWFQFLLITIFPVDVHGVAFSVSLFFHLRLSLSFSLSPSLFRLFVDWKAS